jgi:GTP cyclohydrolase I
MMATKKNSMVTTSVKSSAKNATKRTAKKTVLKKLPSKKISAGKKADGLPLSVVIRRRIQAQNQRFHANDNIAQFIEPGELDQMVDEVAGKVQALLESLIIDTQSDHNTRGTAYRVAKMYVNEVFHGRYVEQPKLTRFPNVSHLNELMIIGPIAVRSACSHHLCPIMGRVWIGVLPDKKTELIGLSKYARITEWIMCRPQIQEEAVVELADILEEKMKPTGLALVMQADHFCMQWRGVKDLDSRMINSVMRGLFLKDASLRREFLSLIEKK